MTHCPGNSYKGDSEEEGGEGKRPLKVVTAADTYYRQLSGQ